VTTPPATRGRRLSGQGHKGRLLAVPTSLSVPTHEREICEKEPSEMHASRGLHSLGDAIGKGDPVNGNAGEIVDAAGGHVGLLCIRLAP